MKERRKVVLIADDDPDDRMFLERTLHRLDEELCIRTVRDGTEALEYLDGAGAFADRKGFPFPTFMFVDLKMPRVDGFSVLEHVKSHPQWAVIPTIVLSASSDPDDIKKAFLSGASAYHVKPATAEARDHLCRVLLDYWDVSEVPETDEEGNQVKTSSSGKLGERIPQP
jgi:CheY-like chemotaxis protein